eukprot:430665_1
MIFFVPTKEVIQDLPSLKDYCNDRTFEQLSNGVRAIVVLVNHMQMECIDIVFFCIGKDSIDKPKIYAIVSNLKNELKLVDIHGKAGNVCVVMEDIGRYIKGQDDESERYCICSTDRDGLNFCRLNVNVSNVNQLIDLFENAKIKSGSKIDAKQLIYAQKDNNNNNNENNNEFKLNINNS